MTPAEREQIRQRQSTLAELDAVEAEDLVGVLVHRIPVDYRECKVQDGGRRMCRTCWFDAVAVLDEGALAALIEDYPPAFAASVYWGEAESERPGDGDKRRAAFVDSSLDDVEWFLQSKSEVFEGEESAEYEEYAEHVATLRRLLTSMLAPAAAQQRWAASELLYAGTVSCPRCGAEPSRFCHDEAGDPCHPHAARIGAAVAERRLRSIA